MILNSSTGSAADPAAGLDQKLQVPVLPRRVLCSIEFHMRNVSRWLIFAVSVVLGVTIFAVGFRLTSEVTVVLAATVLVGGALGLVLPDRPWLWGLGLGIGMRISALVFREPPLSPEHVAKYGPSQPLPLPFGLTVNPLAQWIAGSVLIMAFPFVRACFGWMLRRITGRLTN